MFQTIGLVTKTVHPIMIGYCPYAKAVSLRFTGCRLNVCLFVC